jgi:hypothetical protein
MSTLSDKFLVHYGGESGAIGTDDKSGITLTLTNSPTSVSGKVGNAINFVAASEQYLSVTDNASLSLTSAVNYWGYWARLASKGEDGVDFGRTFVRKDEGSVNREYGQMFNRGADRFQMELRTNASDPDEFAILELDTFGSPSLDTWYWIEWRTDGTNLYGCVNRGTEDSVSATFSGNNSTAPFSIGAFAAIAGWYMDGLIDGLLFGKTLPDTDERDWLYNSGNGRTWAAIVTGPTVPSTTLGRLAGRRFSLAGNHRGLVS